MASSKDYIIGIFAGLLSLNLWYASSLAITHHVMPTTYEYITDTIVILVAAFFGSYSAYYLNDRKEQRKLKNKEIDYMRVALFITLRQTNTLLTIKNAIEPWKDDPLNFLNMRGILCGDYADLKIDLSSLRFLLISEDPNLLFALSIEQEKFELSIDLLKRRNAFDYDIFQTALNKSDLTSYNLTLKEVTEIVGHKTVVTAIKLTQDLFSHVDDTYASLAEAHYKLFLAAKRRFPDHVFVRFEEFEGD